MGNFYVNITTKKASPQEVVRYIKSIAEIGMLNHDDDVLAYELWSNGQKVDEYDSCPGYFQVMKAAWSQKVGMQRLCPIY